MPRSRKVDQIGMDEEVRDLPDLEAALDLRERRRSSLQAVNLDYQEAHEKAIGEIAKLELAPGQVVRVGRFRIEMHRTPAGTVEFERKESIRPSITAGED